MTLEELIKTVAGSEIKVFENNGKLTADGNAAYDKLVEIIEGVGSLTNSRFTQTIIDQLDSIVDENIVEEVDQEAAMNCAKETAKYLAAHGLHEDVLIYVNGARYTITDEGTLKYDSDCRDPKAYLDYAGNFMSMSFEGPLYDVMNYYNDFLSGYDEKRQEELGEIFKKYGKYYELGHAWSLSLYDL